MCLRIVLPEVRYTLRHTTSAPYAHRITVIEQTAQARRRGTGAASARACASLQSGTGDSRPLLSAAAAIGHGRNRSPIYQEDPL